MNDNPMNDVNPYERRFSAEIQILKFILMNDAFLKFIVVNGGVLKFVPNNNTQEISTMT